MRRAHRGPELHLQGELYEVWVATFDGVEAMAAPTALGGPEGQGGVAVAGAAAAREGAADTLAPFGYAARVRRAVVLLALTVGPAAACVAGTEALEPGDGPAIDGGFAERDAAARGDASLITADAAAGAPDRGGTDAGASECPATVAIDLGLTGDGSPMMGLERRITGRARVASWLPDLTLVFDSGERVVITGRIRGTEWPAEFPATVDADVLIRQPHWTEVVVALRSTVLDSSPVVAFTAWSIAHDRVPLGAERIHANVSPCATEAVACGRRTPLDLTFLLADGSTLDVPPGTRAELGPRYQLVNGASHAFLEGASCDDAPDLWIAGYFVERRR